MVTHRVTEPQTPRLKIKVNFLAFYSADQQRQQIDVGASDKSGGKKLAPAAAGSHQYAN